MSRHWDKQWSWMACHVQAVAGSCGDISVISVVEAQVLFLLKGVIATSSLNCLI